MRCGRWIEPQEPLLCLSFSVYDRDIDTVLPLQQSKLFNDERIRITSVVAFQGLHQCVTNLRLRDRSLASGVKAPVIDVGHPAVVPRSWIQGKEADLGIMYLPDPIESPTCPASISDIDCALAGPANERSWSRTPTAKVRP
jgi:hypothetical protein